MEPYEVKNEQVGTLDDTLIILDTISQGAKFRVLKARRATKLVTLKAAVTPDAMYTEILRREYELGSTLSHACVVTTLGFEEHSTLGGVIVMEYIEGVTLDKFISSQPSHKARMSAMYDILNGVEYLHHRGILHNDLKPTNIIINRYGAARIIDFGFSISDDSLWSGCTGGSNHFSAPEILCGSGPKGTASDIYSIGRLIEALFERGRYESIVRRCLNPIPELRYHNIGELKRALTVARWLPTLIVSALLLIAIVTMIVAPYIRRAYDNHIVEKYRVESSATLQNYYNEAMQYLLAHPFSEFAIMGRGIYTLKFMEYRDSLPTDKRIVAEEIAVQHIAEFDSLIIALPTIHKEPIAIRDSLQLQLNQIEL